MKRKEYVKLMEEIKKEAKTFDIHIYYEICRGEFNVYNTNGFDLNAKGIHTLEHLIYAENLTNNDIEAARKVLQNNSDFLIVYTTRIYILKQKEHIKYIIKISM